MTTLRDRLNRIATEFEEKGEIPADLALQVIAEIKPNEAIQPRTDECQKIVDVQEQSIVLSGFYDWLGEQKIRLCHLNRYEESEWRDDSWYPISEGANELFARYFEIDLDKVEEQRRALLDKLRADNEARESGDNFDEPHPYAKSYGDGTPRGYCQCGKAKDDSIHKGGK